MALYRVRVVLSQSTNIPSDRVTWSWGVDGPAPDEAAADAMAEAWRAAVQPVSGTQLANYLAAGLVLLGLEVYPAAGGAAVALGQPASGWARSGGGRLPSEVAIAVSSLVSTLRGNSPMGRQYLGPLDNTANNHGRPATGALSAALNYATRLHNGMEALGYNPVVLAGDGSVSRGQVVSYSVDDAFDTQRRRGWEKTSITTAAP